MPTVTVQYWDETPAEDKTAAVQAAFKDVCEVFEIWRKSRRDDRDEILELDLASLKILDPVTDVLVSIECERWPGDKIRLNMSVPDDKGDCYTITYNPV